MKIYRGVFLKNFVGKDAHSLKRRSDGQQKKGASGNLSDETQGGRRRLSLPLPIF